jgi:hypothetical protein
MGGQVQGSREESAFSVPAVLRFVLWVVAVLLWSAAFTAIGTIVRGLLDTGLWVKAGGPLMPSSGSAVLDDPTAFAWGVAAVGTAAFLALCVGVIGGVIDVRIGRRDRWWLTLLLAFAVCAPLSWRVWMGLSAPLPSVVLPVVSLAAMLAGQAIGMQSRLSAASNQGIERTPSALD